MASLFGVQRIFGTVGWWRNRRVGGDFGQGLGQNWRRVQSIFHWVELKMGHKTRDIFFPCCKQSATGGSVKNKVYNNMTYIPICIICVINGSLSLETQENKTERVRFFLLCTRNTKQFHSLSDVSKSTIHSIPTVWRPIDGFVSMYHGEY